MAAVAFIKDHLIYELSPCVKDLFALKEYRASYVFSILWVDVKYTIDRMLASALPRTYLH